MLPSSFGTNRPIKYESLMSNKKMFINLKKKINLLKKNHLDFFDFKYYRYHIDIEIYVPLMSRLSGTSILFILYYHKVFTLYIEFKIQNKYQLIQYDKCFHMSFTIQTWKHIVSVLDRAETHFQLQA